MLKIQGKGPELTIIPQKNIVSQDSTGFLGELKSLDLTGVQTLVVDMSQVELIDSMGLGALIALHKSLKERGLGLRVIKVNPDIYYLMLSMGMDGHFRIEK